MNRLSDERLRELANEASLVAEICEKHGETSGRTAAQSIHRALTSEIERRGQPDAGAGH